MARDEPLRGLEGPEREASAGAAAGDAVEEIEIRLFLEALYARYGVDLRGYSAASIRRRVLAALERSGLAHLGELQHAVLRDPARFAAVVEDLTVHVTEMFRDPAFYQAFRARVVPILRTYPLLRIWHAGCATGEEVYASAILLSEAGLYDRVQIYATDISAQALARARRGTYAAAALAPFTHNYRQGGGTADFARWCTAAYDGIAMQDGLRRNILFLQHDLVSDHVFGEFHVVFCRNVLMYFGRELRERVLGKLAESLCPGGFLCLGAGERLEPSGHARDFAPFAAGERIYRYEGAGGRGGLGSGGGP